MFHIAAVNLYGDAIAAETERKNSWTAWFDNATTGVKAVWNKWFGDTKTSWISFDTSANQAESSRVSEYASLREDIMEKTEAANNAADRVDESILDVSTEKNAALKAAEDATAKVNEMNTGLARLEELEATLTAKDRLQPTSMTLTYPKKITFGNTAEKRVEATLSPAGTGKNVLFLSDNRSVQVMPDGFIRVLNVGKSFVHAIPTENTAIYQTVEIEVLPTPIRKVTSTAMRLTSSGAMRLG